jgi:hypothetical protein
MARAALLAAFVFVLVFAAGTSRSDVAPDSSATSDVATTTDPNTAVQPSEGQKQKDPFAPYDVGGPEAIWPYDSLTPEEKAVIDRTRDANGWAATHDGFGAAALDRSRKARAQAAEHQLGVDNLELSGVVQ